MPDDMSNPADATSGGPVEGASDSIDRRTRILEAAVAEFAAGGLAGARVDNIAQRAGVNKQLIYHYFGDKAGLFDAAVRTMAQRFERVRSDLPEPLGARLVAYYDGARRDVDVIRMLEWEALESTPGDYVEHERRRDHMRDAVDRLADERDAGRFSADLDPAHLFLSFQALAAHPIAFPQMTWFITGRGPDDPRFIRERRAFLRQLGAVLEAG